MQRSFGAMRINSSSIVAAVIAGCVLLSVGCSPQAKKARHLARAEHYAQVEKYREATIEYMNVLQVEPTNRVAVRGIGLSLYQLGEMRAAMPYLHKAEDLDPNDVDVRLKVGALFLVFGDRVQARQRAELVLKRTPDNLEALVLWAAGITTSNEVDTAIARLSSFGARFEAQPKYYVTLASLYVNKGDFDEAEGVYRKALLKIPKSWEVHLSLGDLYYLRRDSSRAGEEYQTAADLAPYKSMARVKLARFRRSEGRKAEAKQILDDLMKKVPGFSAAVFCRAEIAFGECDYEAAMNLLSRIMKAEPSNLEAFLLMQRVKLAQGKDDEAIAAYTKLVSALPKAAQGRYLLGMAWLHKGDIRKAMEECERAVALDADHLDSVRLLAELYIRTGQPDRALAIMKPYGSRHPSEVSIYVLIGAAHSAKKDFNLAAAAYQALMKISPNNPRGPYLLGLALRRLGRDAEAIGMFEEALKMDPGSMDALEPLAEMLAAKQKNWDAALERIEKQIEKVPDAAGLRYLLGNALSRKQDWDNAEKAFQKAIELKPGIASAYLGLSYVYVATHKEEQALGKLDSALSVNSNDVASLMLKGILLMKRNDLANAAIQYQRILAVSPNFVPALNNLACLYQYSPPLKEKTYEFARRARDLAPKDPSVADTFGWILFQRGEYKRALILLQEGAESLDREAEVLYHLGMCQAALGDAVKARISLSRAMELAKTFPGSVEAEEMLSVLSASDNLNELSSAGQVESFLAKYSGIPFALVKGGAFYEQAGDFGRARSLYEKALARNGHFVPAMICLANLCSEHLNQLDQALTYARQAREEASGDSMAADALAAIAFRKGDAKWAQSLLEESISRSGATPERQYLLGLINFALGKIDDSTNLICQAQGTSSPGTSAAAKQFLDRVRNPGPAMGEIHEADMTNSLTVENLPLLMHLANACEQEGDTARARALYEQVVARYPDFSPAFRRLALSYVGQKIFSDKEFKVLVKARELLPSDPHVGRVLGEAAYHKGQYEWASRLLQEATDKASYTADVYYYLGMSYHQLKDKEAAKKALKLALKMDPKSELAAAAQRILNQIQ